MVRILYNNNYDSDNFPSRFENGEAEKILIKDYTRFERGEPAYLLNIDNYPIEPLDIIKIFKCYRRKGEECYMVHAGIYLGRNNNNRHKICHVLAENNGVVRIDDWQKFIGSSNLRVDKIFRYRLTANNDNALSKESEEIRRHIAKCKEGSDKYFSNDGFGGFSIKDEPTNNCEQFVNRCVFSLDFSELVDSIYNRREEKILDLNTRTQNEDRIDNLTELEARIEVIINNN